MNWASIIALIVAGLVLLAVDFYLPGFVLGTIGAVLMLVAAGIAFSVQGLNVAAALLCGEAVAAGAVVYASVKLFPKTAAGRRMILAHSQAGGRAQMERLDELVGREGIAHTVLRPAGVAIVDGKRLDVIAESDMIERGAAVKVVAVEGNRVVVRRV